MLRTKEIDGWYKGAYYILVFEPAPPEILIDSFEKDGFQVETQGDAFEHFCQLALESMVEGYE